MLLERILSNYLTKKGKIGYLIGTVISFSLWAYYVLGIREYSLEEGRTMFFVGIVVLNVLWIGVCLLLWKIPKEEKTSI